VRRFLERNGDRVDRVIFCLFLKEDVQLYRERLGIIFPPTPRTEKTEEADEKKEDDKSDRDSQPILLPCSILLHKGQVSQHIPWRFGCTLKNGKVRCPIVFYFSVRTVNSPPVDGLPIFEHFADFCFKLFFFKC